METGIKAELGIVKLKINRFYSVQHWTFPKVNFVKANSVEFSQKLTLSLIFPKFNFYIAYSVEFLRKLTSLKRIALNFSEN